ncbi:MAG: PEP-CTERM sorting domain-containing protein [Crocosphaera sp.]
MNHKTILATAILTTLSLTTIQNSVSAANVDLGVSKPLGDGFVVIDVTFDDVTLPTFVPIKATNSATEKRAAILLGLLANGFDTETDPETQTITINNLTEGTKVTFTSLNTGEKSDTLVAENDSSFHLWEGSFNPVDPLGELSTFLAGYSSTLGEVSLELTSDQFTDLAPETLATTFFNELVDDADLIGINLSLDGSTISANYDTGVLGTGVQFGTTSGSGTVGASVTLAVPEPLTILGSATALGFGALFKRKLKGSKTTQKVG